MNVKHIFFDLDHTLWDFDKNSKLTFEQLFKELNILIDIDVFLETYMPINFEYWRLYREDKISKSNLKYKRLKDTFDALNYEVSDNVINSIAEDYINYLPNNNHLLDGALELLEYLKLKYKLHIITNGFEEVQNLKMQKSGILQYFDKIITSESVGVKKPNPKIFDFALTLANAKPEESIMIGDSYEADIMGAIKFGMLAIHFDYYKNATQKGLISITSLEQIKQYL